MSSSTLLIRNGTIVNDDFMIKADILVEGGKITAVGENLAAPKGDVRMLDATNRYVMPGGIDPHTHMQLPFMGMVTVDDYYHGTRAALSGGTTMIIDFVVPSKDSSPLKGYLQWKGWADPKVCCDYGLSVAITNWNDETAAEMEKLTSPEYGINSFKFYLAYKDDLMVDDDQFFKATCAVKGSTPVQLKAQSSLQIALNLHQKRSEAERKLGSATRMRRWV